ncbi:heavy-metal-associated domain-containing protein [Microlunatus flavus]|uniref:Copper chaperone CopZ n=1 Tax=Microlunatus flavus TaxID=1036181 RepID=A0A1H9B295_9ACTN|nr:heavy metal-associated domain-containing protein [Microlunatus flavus]SEP83156.1 Copper chaperone CopZ [Microlunatus flavus]
MSTTQDYVVAGMTCEHCTQAVTEEVLGVPGVQEVKVLLDGGQMTVTSTEPVDFEVLEAAVSEAGYTLGSR